MYHPLFLALTLALLQACGNRPAVVSSSKPAESASNARISLEEARSTALTRIPGKVVKEELEHEDGRWVYSFEIQPDAPSSKLKEVHVDPNDRSILAVEDEEEEVNKGDHDEDDEKEDKK